jgi:serine/threonine-protein kinase
MATSMTRPMPEKLGRYQVCAKIADGGMATIYLGRMHDAVGTDGTVAIKVVKDEFALNMEFVHMFVDEGKIASRLNHPNIVKIHEFSADDDRLFIAMDFLLGQSLWSVWQACQERGVRLRYDMIAWIGARVCDALQHAHDLHDERGAALELVHRDVNATNIFIEYGGVVKVIDFGLAKAVDNLSRTDTGVVKGKLGYLSPEQITGMPIDRRADIFALGTTLWELSVDRRLFKVKSDLETVNAVRDARVPDPTRLVAGYPPKLWKILMRALVRDRDSRYATAREMGKALDTFAQSEGRTIGAELVAEAMASLFQAERDRHLKWLEEAVDPSRTSKRPLKPPADQIDFSGMGSKLAPRAGTFEQAAKQATPSGPPPARSTAPTVPPEKPGDPHPTKKKKIVASEIPEAEARRLRVLAAIAGVLFALVCFATALLLKYLPR